MPTCKQCEAQFPNTKVIEGKRRNLSSRQYCLECSPFGEHNTTRLHEVEEDEPECICDDCGRTYTHNRSKGHRGSRCNSCRTKQRRVERKKRLVELFGGECPECGYSECFSALTFHHLDPAAKEFTICGNEYNRKWEDVLTEARKCKMLCHNCHEACHCSRCDTTQAPAHGAHGDRCVWTDAQEDGSA